ncbi:hypothetical protein [Halorubrum laminariae]|uniref:Cox cluster protein n=1 Tax=Halorubrum laminariae TaxID=1433523 RepID=A0ABD6C1R0_9EURY|nr:hypothetical protein [Halorubrum laminariae]
MEESQNRLGAYLVGDDLDLTKRWGAIAASLFVVTFAIYVFGYYQTVYALIPGRVIVYGAAGILVLLSAWQAYQNRSLVGSLLLCIAPVTALFFTIIGEGQVTDPTVAKTLLLGTGWGLVFGVPLGVLGFILGYAGRVSTDRFIRYSE